MFLFVLSSEDFIFCSFALIMPMMSLLLTPGQTATIHNPANTSLLSSKLTYNDGELEARVVKSISKSHPLDLTKPCYLFFARGRSLLEVGGATGPEEGDTLRGSGGSSVWI